MSELQSETTTTAGTVRQTPAHAAERMPPAARRLGFLGLLPFFGPALALLLLDLDADAHAFLVRFALGYGAVILSFLGGVRWGQALGAPAARAHVLFLISILPALGAWVAVMLPPRIAFEVLCMAFILQGIWDIVDARRGILPGWYGRLRLELTIATALFLAVASFLVS